MPFHRSLPPHWWQRSVLPNTQWDISSLASEGKPVWTAGRASLWGEHIGSLLRVEWNLERPWSFWSVTFSVDGSEREWHLGIAAGAFSLYFIGSLPRQVKLPCDYEREVGITWHRWYLHLYLWADPDRWESEADWSNPASSLRKPLFNLNPFALIAGGFRCDVECLGTEQRTILMPEGAYPVTVKRMVRQWTYPRWKHIWPIPRRRYSIEVESETGIPIPGKGDNAWDIEDDAIFGIGMYTRDVEQALRKATDDILDTRRKRGGDDWRPGREDGAIISSSEWPIATPTEWIQIVDEPEESEHER